LITKDKPKHSINTDPEEPTEMGYMIGLFDVLGFSDLCKLGTIKLLAVYQELIDKVVAKKDEDFRCFTLMKIGDVKVPALGSLPVRYVYFSDTILLWAPLVEYLVEPFAARCSDMIIEGLNLGIPFRGSITIGGAIMNKQKNIFLGQPLIEADRLEKAQNWIGVSFGPSSTHPIYQDSLGHNFVIQYYTKHFKSGKEDLISQMVLDWPRRMRERYKPEETIAKLNEMKNNTGKKIYYDNALDFIYYSENNKDWFKNKS